LADLSRRSFRLADLSRRSFSEGGKQEHERKNRPLHGVLILVDDAAAWWRRAERKRPGWCGPA
jgi:hypothetical protein